MSSKFYITGEIIAAMADAFDSFARDSRNSSKVLVINSNGGNIRSAKRMMALIMQRPSQYTAHIVGSCRSAAQMVSMCCQRITAEPNAELGIHCCQYVDGIQGNQHGLIDAAESLQSTDAIIASMACKRTQLSRPSIEELMAANAGEGTRFSAIQAFDIGLVDELVEQQTESYPANAIFKLWSDAHGGPIGAIHRSIESALSDIRRRGMPCRVVWRAGGMRDWQLIGLFEPFSMGS